MRERIGLRNPQGAQGGTRWFPPGDDRTDGHVQRLAERERSLVGGPSGCRVRRRAVHESARFVIGERPHVLSPGDEILVSAESLVAGLLAVGVEEVEGGVATDETVPPDVLWCFHQRHHSWLTVARGRRSIVFPSNQPLMGTPPGGRDMWKPLATLVALSVAAFAYVTTESLPIGLLLPIAADLRVSPSTVGLLVTAYGLVVVVASIPLTYVTRGLPRRILLAVPLAVFGMASLVSATASSYEMLLVSRVVTALSHGLFWALVVPAAASLFGPGVRGRVVAVVFAGASLAAVAGVPAGTWIGQLAGWRVAFLALSAVVLAALLVVVSLLPTSSSEPSSQGGPTKDSRRYWILVATTVLAVTGAFANYTYVTAFLTDVSAFALVAIAPILLIRGLSGLVGVGFGGLLADRRPWAAMVTPVAVQAAALLGLFVLGDHASVAVALVALSGLTFAALTAALGGRVLQVAPWRPELSAAGLSTAVNIGITGGALIGSILLPMFGVRSTALVGGVLSLAAAIVAISERLLQDGPETGANRRRVRTSAAGSWATGDLRVDEAGRSWGTLPRRS